MKWQKAFIYKLSGYVFVITLVTILGRSSTFKRGHSRFPSSIESPTCLEVITDFLSSKGPSSQFSRRYLKAYKKIVSRGKVRPEQVDELVNLIARELGPRKTTLSYHELRNNLTHEAFNKQVYRQGIEASLLERGVEIRESGILTRFFNSKTGEVLATTFGALGTPWGVPPLYLPSGKLFSLDAQELELFSTLSFETAMTKYVERNGLNSLSSIESRVLYQYAREHYMKFAAFTSSLLGAYWFYEGHQQVNDEEDMLLDMNSGADELLSGVRYFEDQGISLSQKGEDLKVIRECIFVEECVTSQGIEKGSTEYSQYHEACRTFLGASAQCQIK